MTYDWQAVFDAIPLLLQGLQLTVVIAGVGLLGGIATGVAAGVALTYGNAIARTIAQAYVAVIRGTPIVVQVMFVYFALPLLLQIRLGATEAAIITIIFNSGAYNAEIVRGALQSVPRGLIEAALSMGLPFRRVLAFVVAPIAYRLAMPAMGNQVVNVIKDTSIFLVIGVGELTRRGQEIMAENFRAVEIWSAVAVLYFILITSLAYALRLYERKVRLP
jgi:glutamine transport system permease protein